LTSLKTQLRRKREGGGGGRGEEEEERRRAFRCCECLLKTCETHALKEAVPEEEEEAGILVRPERPHAEE
jgi:hypothetical protein